MQLTATTAADISRDQVRDYYGRQLQSSADLKTSACCSTEAIPAHHKPILALLADEVLAKFYGCGSPIPAALEGCTVLDLGCGTGRDAFVAAALAGPEGRVIGVDMTEEQLAVATRYEAEHATRFGFAAPNTDFRLGTIEDLGALGLDDASADVVISNCVLNLAPDQETVFREIFRVLKPGGELYFSDVFCDRRLPAHVTQDPVLVGECLGGAFYDEDFRRLMARIGWPDYRIVAQSVVTVDDPALQAKLGNARFLSRTIRAFKLASLEDRCEDHGQVAYYRGGIEGSEHAFTLDDHHVFEKDRPMLVCGNSAAMVEETRFGRYFEVVGDRSVHYGLFDCAPVAAAEGDASAGSCC
ncbi:MAG: methyltransferase domain-containing protein [Rhodothermaceae bacterium]|nr:methyltransferase domain-containing protein [Rhodothermaceae bacterium]